MRRQVVAFGLMVVSLAVFAEGEPESRKECVAAWAGIVSPARKLTVQQQRDAWAEYKNKCEASGAFEYFGAKIDLEAGDFDDARSKARKLANVPDLTLRIDAARLVADSYYFELARTSAPTDSQWTAVEKNYQAIVDRYPDSYAGYDGLAAVALVRKDFAKVVQAATRANEKYPTARAFRKLAIAYAQMDKYPEAIAAGSKAVAMDPDLSAERDMMLAVTLAQIEVGQLTEARKSLNVLLSYNSALKDDRGLINMVRYLRQRETDSTNKR